MDDWEEELESVGAMDRPARGGGRRAKAPISMEYVRDMTEEDLMELAKPAEVRLPAVQRLRHSHHQLARMVAMGHRGVNIEKMVGYDKQMIYNLCADPAFMELVEFYKVEINTAYKDAAEEIADMGMTLWKDLFDRYQADPEEFTNEELFKFGGEFVGRTILPEKGKTITAGSGSGPRIGVQIAFVAPAVQPKEVESNSNSIEVSYQPSDDSDETEND